MVPWGGRAAPPNVLQRRLRARVENPQQPVVRPSRGEEARQRHLPPVRTQRGEGTPGVGPRKAAGHRSRGAETLARGAPPVGSGSHHSGRRRRRRVRPRELPPALPAVPCSRHARMASAAHAGWRDGSRVYLNRATQRATSSQMAAESGWSSPSYSFHSNGFPAAARISRFATVLRSGMLRSCLPSSHSAGVSIA